jgi:hypothetical protein
MAEFGTLAAIGDYFVWWQLLLLIALVALIVFWVMYRRKQM